MRTAPGPALGAAPPREAAPAGERAVALLLRAIRRPGGPAEEPAAPAPPARTHAPRVLAVLVACDGERWLRRTLAALAAQTRHPDVLVAVDAGSVDASAALLSAAAGGAAGEHPPGGLLRVSRRAGILDAARAALVLDDSRHLDDHLHPEDAERPATPDGELAPPAPAGTTLHRDEWVWLLHDDGAPAPDALEHLLAAVEVAPGIGVAGAKLTDWDDPRRLQQVGLTTSRLGRRFTGVEHDDVDQGQRDDQEDVLAVSTAGMLVRRDLLDRLGSDPALAHLGEDLDLCQRARLAGHRVVVVPRAVVHHVDATRTGQRATPAARWGSRWAARRQEVHRRLVTAPLLLLPLVVLATLAGGLARAVGRVAAKQPGLAPREVAAVLGALSGLVRPARTWTARRTWRTGRTEGADPLAPLQAPPREVWRWHRDRWQRGDWTADPDDALPPAADDAEEDGEQDDPVGPGDAPAAPGSGSYVDTDTGGLLLTPPPRPAPAAPAPGASGQRPAGRVLALLLLVALLGAAAVGLRPLLGTSSVAGPALAPAPELAALWRAVSTTWSPAGLGAPLPGDPVWAVLGALAVPAGGSPALAVTVLLVLALPLAGWGGWAAAGAVTSSRSLRLVAALVWASAAPLLRGLDDGRLGAVIAHLALPWVALGVARAVTARSRRTALTGAAGSGLLAAVAVAGAPVLLPALLAAVVGVAVVTRRRASTLAWSVLAAVVAVGPLLVVALADPRALVADPGPAAASTPPPAWALLLAQPADPGPGWLAQLVPPPVLEGLGAPGRALAGASSLLLPAVLVVATAAGSLLLTRSGSSAAALAGRRARAGWALAALGVATAAVSASTALAPPSTTAWPGAGTSLVALGVGVGALGGAERVRRAVFDRVPAQASSGSGARVAAARRRVRRSRWRASAAGALCALAVLPVGTLAGWAASGSGQVRPAVPSLPAVAADAGAGPDAVRTLDLTASTAGAPATVTATVSRGPVTLLDASAARTAAGLSGPLLGPVTTGGAADPGGSADPGGAEAPADPGTAALASAAAMLAAGSGDPRPLLLGLGVGYVFVRGDASLDGVQNLARAGATPAGVLYRVRTDADTDPAVAAGTDPGRPARARLLAADGRALAVLPSAGEQVTARLPPAEAADRRVVLAERDDPGWVATLDGAPLRRVLVDGWAVGFEVPATGGLLRVEHDGGPLVLWPWLQGAVLLLTVLLAIPVPGAGRRERRAASEPVPEGRT